MGAESKQMRSKPAIPDWSAEATENAVRAFADAVDGLGGGTEIIVGIPTYDDALPGHLASVENVESAVQGVQAGIAALANPALVQGVAIYAEWETDPLEWAQYDSFWLR